MIPFQPQSLDKALPCRRVGLLMNKYRPPLTLARIDEMAKIPAAWLAPVFVKVASRFSPMLLFSLRVARLCLA